MFKSFLLRAMLVALCVTSFADMNADRGGNCDPCCPPKVKKVKKVCAPCCPPKVKKVKAPKESKPCCPPKVKKAKKPKCDPCCDTRSSSAEHMSDELDARWDDSK